MKSHHENCMCFWVTLPFLSFLFCLQSSIFPGTLSNINIQTSALWIQHFLLLYTFFMLSPDTHEQKVARGMYLKRRYFPFHTWIRMQLQTAAVKQNLFVMNNCSGAHWASGYLLLVKGLPRSVVVCVIAKHWAVAQVVCVGTSTPYSYKRAWSSGLGSAVDRGGRRWWHSQAAAAVSHDSWQSCWEGDRGAPESAASVSSWVTHQLTGKGSQPRFCRESW